MTAYEMQMLDWMEKIYLLFLNFNTNISAFFDKVSFFLQWFQHEFSIVFFLLLTVIIGLLVLKWIARW